MIANDFTRIVKLDRLPSGTLAIEANEAERAALALRFGLPRVDSLTAEFVFARRGDAIDARGHIRAAFQQLCAITTEPFAATIDEPVVIRFVPALAVHGEDEEIAFDSDAPDEIEYDGAAFDIGEAAAQSFGLALDPYAEGPQAELVRREAGLLDEDVPSGPFAALAALKAGTKAS